MDEAQSKDFHQSVSIRFISVIRVLIPKKQSPKFCIYFKKRQIN